MTTETQTTAATAANTTEGQATSATAAASTDTSAAATSTTQQQQQSADAGTAQAKPGDAAGDTKNADDKPAGAPDKYEFKPADGREFDPDVIKQFSEVAREINLPQDAAQKVLDKLAPALEAKQARMIEDARAQWAESVKADKEIGGDKVAERLGIANKAIAEFGTPELAELLKTSGLGEHPEIIRAFLRVGKAISEDGRFVTGSKGNPPATLAQRMYPGMNP